MAQYDGSVRINTEIETKKAKIQLTSMENRIVKAADKVDSLRSKMNALKDVKTPTQEYKEIADQIKKAEQEFNKLFDKQEQMQREGKDSGAAWDNLSEKMDEVGNTIRYAQGELQDLVDTGKAFTLGSDSEEFSKLGQQLKYAENDLNLLNEKYDLQSQKLKKLNGDTDSTEKKYSKLRETVKKLSSAFNKVTNVIQKTTVNAFKKLGSVISGTFKKAASIVGSFAGKIKDLAHRHMPKLRKETEKTKSSFTGFGRRIKELALSALIFNRLSAAFNSMITGMKDGFANLFDQVDSFRLSVNTLRASFLTLKNALAGAFRPLIEIAIPYIQKAVEYITMLVGSMGQLFSALTGQSTYTRAIKMTADYFEDEEEAAKKAKDAAEGYLSPLDEINQYNKEKKDEEEKKDEIKTPMFEEVPIEGKFFDIANKIKDILSKLFAPLKEAWNREGKFVMDSWKYALGEIWKLAKDIGRDFLKVWNQEATIAMLADMLHIIGDIGLIVGNLAKNFRVAWNYNNTGLHILENIRDIFAAIIHNIRLAADYTVEWSKHLDFRPLLTSIEVLTKSLIRFADFLSGTLADFWTEFILPLTSWTLSEQGIPRLLNILAAFMNEINWEGLRAALKGLYQALEPYAEEIGNGLLDFIEKVKEEGVEFFNFLPGAIQRAADALRAGDLPAAFEEFGSISGEAVKMAFNNIRHAIESINWGEIGTLIASFINGIDWMGVGQSLFGALVSAINGAISLLHNFIMTMDWTSLGTALGANLQNAWNSINWQQAGETIGAGIRGILNFLVAFVQELDWPQIGRDIGTLLSEIPWGEIFTQVFTIIWEVLSGLISGLLDTKAGKVIVAIGTGILAIKGLFNVADFALTVAQWATGGTNKFSLLSQGAELLKNNLASTTGIIGSLFSPTGLMVAGIVAGAAWIITHWDEVSGTFSYLWENILVPLGEFVSTVFTAVWEDVLSPALQYLGETVLPILSDTLSNLWKNVIEPLAKFIADVFKPIIERLTEIFEVLWKNVIAPFAQFLGTVLVGAFEIITTVLNNVVIPIVGAVIQVFQFLWEHVLSPIVSFVGDTLFPIFSSVFESIGNVIENARRMFQGLIDFVAGVFTGDWSRAWDGIKNIFGGAWDGLVSLVKSPINAIIGFMNMLISGVASMVNNIAKMLNHLKIDVPEGVPFVGGMKLGFNLPTWTPGKIPYLATGTVVPPNREFMAVLGDNKREPEVVSPISTIEKAVENVLSRNSGTGREINIRIPVILEGKQIYEAVIKQGKIQQMSTGNNGFMLGTT